MRLRGAHTRGMTYLAPSVPGPLHDSAPDHVWQVPVLPRHPTPIELGEWGEELVARHLEAQGMRILARNWRSRFGELDLIISDPNRQAIVAVEVKTRRRGGQVSAIEALSRAKLARLRRLLTLWIGESGCHGPLLAIDLCAVTLDGHGDWQIHHVEDIQ